MAAIDPTDEDYEPKTAIRRLSASLDQPDKFAEIFCSAAKSQKNIDATLKDVMRDLLKSDKDTRDFVKDLLREVEHEDWRLFVKKFGGLLWALLLIAFGAILTVILEKF